MGDPDADSRFRRRSNGVAMERANGGQFIAAKLLDRLTSSRRRWSGRGSWFGGLGISIFVGAQSAEDGVGEASA
jgi:hypothetical protein